MVSKSVECIYIIQRQISVPSKKTHGDKEGSQSAPEKDDGDESGGDKDGSNRGDLGDSREMDSGDDGKKSDQDSGDGGDGNEEILPKVGRVNYFLEAEHLSPSAKSKQIFLNDVLVKVITCL